MSQPRPIARPRRTPALPLAATLALALALTATLAEAAPSSPRASAGAVDRHALHLVLDPGSRAMAISGRLVTEATPSLPLVLHPGLELVSLTCGGADVLDDVRRIGPDGRSDAMRLDVPRACRTASGTIELTWQATGIVADPIEEEESLHFVTGDRTAGTIGLQGAFLTGATGWYLGTRNLATFDLTVDVPEGWRAVSQGRWRQPREEPARGRRLERWVSELPSDGLALSAGEYVVTARRHGDIELQTWLFEDDPETATLFLDAAARDIDWLEERLGPHLHPKFAIVENFFTTGYGFPSYTLLGANVIAMGARALRPGYLDHEIAHGWWGNGVLVDLDDGNWCEGLTTYCTNYLGVVRNEGEEAARAARAKVSQRYSVDVPPGEEIAPADFVTKTDDAGAAIGYGQVSMIFHRLRQRVGDDAFWRALRELANVHAGRRASWSDIEDAFERASDADLGHVFGQWVERAGLPSLALSDVDMRDGLVTGRIVQSDRTFRLPIEVVATLADGSVASETVTLASGRTPFTIAVPRDARVVRVALDPEWHVPRRVAPADLPPSLARTLRGDRDAAGPLVVVPPSGAVEPSLASALDELATAVARQHGGTIVAADALSGDDWAARPVLILGGAANPASGRIRAALEGHGLALEAGAFEAGGERFDGPSQALLASVAHPRRADSTISVYAPNGAEAARLARYVFFYGWDTWLALENGRATRRSVDWPSPSATTVLLDGWDDPAARSARAATRGPSSPAAMRGPSGDAATRGPSGDAATTHAAGRAETRATGAFVDAVPPAGRRMLDVVRQLARPELRGREAGTESGDLAAREVRGLLAEAGAAPAGTQGHLQPFAFDVFDLPGRPSFRYSSGQRRASVPVMPAHFWLPVPRELDAVRSGSLGSRRASAPALVPLPGGAVLVGRAEPEAFSGLDLGGAAAVVIDEEPPPAPGDIEALEALAQRLWSLGDEALRRNARALVVVRPGEQPPYVPVLAPYASHPGGRIGEGIRRAREADGAVGALRVASGAQARLAPLRGEFGLPTVFAGSELLAALEEAGADRRGERAWEDSGADIALHVAVERRAASNVLGRVRGRGGTDSAVVLSAHFDGLGVAADGTVHEGALDDAAGVAVVLEVARRLAVDPPARDVVVALLDAEEWGLRGARHLVAGWPDSRPVVAVVNVDSVGQAGRALHVIGEEREVALARLIEEALRDEGFEVGQSIDRHADRNGADHWPWVANDVPAVTIFGADYRLINTTGDVVGEVDAETLARLADALERVVRGLAGNAG